MKRMIKLSKKLFPDVHSKIMDKMASSPLTKNKSQTFADEIEDDLCDNAVEQDNISYDEEQVLEEALAKKALRQIQLAKNQAFICGTILTAWLLGEFGFSVAWVLLMTLAVHVMWWSSVVRMVEDGVQYEKLKVRRQKAIEHTESAEWLNFIVNRWWIFSSASVFSRAKALLEPLVNEAKPSILESVVLKEFSLGNQTPSISAIKAFEVINGNRRAMSLKSVANLAGLHSIRYRLVVEADLDLVCPDFKMVLGFYSGKVMGVDFVVTKLSIHGRVQITLQFRADAEFPHVSKATVSFLQKPTVSFDADQKILRSSLKSWANSLFMEILTDAMVDPFRLELNLAQEDNYLPAKEPSNKLAKGVLTVTLSLQPKTGKQATDHDERWCTLKVRDQRHKTCLLPYRYSFLIESLIDDILVIKVKTNRFIGTHTLETFREPLAVIAQDDTDNVERNLSRGNVNLFLRMDYVGLLPPELSPPRRLFRRSAANGPSEPQPNDSVAQDCTDGGDVQADERDTDVVAGVLYICIHEAESLSSGHAKDLPNPYCVVIYNRKKVKTTHYISKTSNPHWETGVELLVSDYSQATFYVTVCSWDTNKMTESDFLGVASVTMASGKQNIVRQSFQLEQSPYQRGSGDSSSNASVTLSVIFRPVPSVAHSGVVLQEDTCPTPRGGNEIQNATTGSMPRKKINAPLKMFLSTGGENSSLTDIPSTLALGHGLMEVTIIKAADLLAKDFNGYSDPYCEVKLNQDFKFKTSVVKKTLNPSWNEKVIMQLPRTEDVLTVTVWDHDVFSRKDFLGSISLTLDDIQTSSSKDTGEWFLLRETRSGSIHLKFCIMTEGLENSEVRSQTVEDLRASTPTLEPTPLRPNFYGEGVLDDPVVNGASVNGDNPAPNLPPKTRSNAQSSPSLVRFDQASSSTSQSTGSSPQLSLRSLTAQSTASSFSSGIQMVQVRRDSEAARSSNNSKPSSLKASAPSPPERKSSLPSSSPPPAADETISSISVHSEEAIQSEEATPATSPISRGSSAYSSLHQVKRKMKKSFSQQLRRFRSEVNVNEDKAKNARERVTIEKRDETYSSCGQIDALDCDIHASPEGTTATNNKRTHYKNVQGTVVQATGLEVPKASHISCRVRLSSNSASKNATKTLSKSKLVQTSPNPAFNLYFQAEPSNGIQSSSAIVFEIRSANKETVASKSITLLELFEGVIEEGGEMRTCLSLNTGATLEVVLSHGKESAESNTEGTKTSQKKVSRLLRSWSIHRIGKI